MGSAELCQSMSSALGRTGARIVGVGALVDGERAVQVSPPEYEEDRFEIGSITKVVTRSVRAFWRVGLSAHTTRTVDLYRARSLRTRRRSPLGKASRLRVQRAEFDRLSRQRGTGPKLFSS